MVKAGANGTAAVIRNPRIQKPGLALTGYEMQLDEGRLLTLGGTEIEYLNNAEPTHRLLATRTVIASRPACIVVTRGLTPPDELLAAVERLTGLSFDVVEIVDPPRFAQLVTPLGDLLALLPVAFAVPDEVLRYATMESISRVKGPASLS